MQLGMPAVPWLCWDQPCSFLPRLLRVLAPLNPPAEIPLGHVGILQASVTSSGCCPVTKTTGAAFPLLQAGSWQG